MYLGNGFVSVNYEILWNPTSQIGKFIDFTSHRHFYPKNDWVSMKNKVLKTDKNNNFSLNSVNGGHSFLSKTNYDFFKYKLHPIAKRVLWPLFTIEDSTATANVKRVWRYLMRWEETRLYASRWRIHIPWITFDTALLRNTAERNRSKLPCCSLPTGTFCYQVHEPTTF